MAWGRALSTLMQRFCAKVQLPSTPDGCWEWTACRNDGYGQLRVVGRTVWAHRYAYERFVGPIQDGLVLDHLCRNPGCVNPAHLEPVTNRENLLRGDTIPALNASKTHCKRGHEFTGRNTGRQPSGGRRCRACDAAYHQRRRDARKALPTTHQQQ